MLVIKIEERHMMMQGPRPYSMHLTVLSCLPKVVSRGLIADVLNFVLNLELHEIRKKVRFTHSYVFSGVLW